MKLEDLLVRVKCKRCGWMWWQNAMGATDAEELDFDCPRCGPDLKSEGETDG